MKAFIPFQTPIFVRQVEAGRYVIREVLDVAMACEVHRSWIGREKAWRRAAETGIGRFAHAVFSASVDDVIATIHIDHLAGH